MLKKTITYTDFNGDEAKEDFFFHLSMAELAELEMSHDGGLSLAMQRIIDANDAKSIIAEFKNIILLSYGKKSTDGRRFIKNEALREEFKSTEAYSTLFMELVTDTQAAIDFMKGVIPSEMMVDVEEITETKPPAKHMTMKEADGMDGKELTDKIISGEIVIVDE